MATKNSDALSPLATEGRLMKFYTVGYGGRNPEELRAILKNSGIRAVADVRLKAESASMGVYTKARTPGKGIQKFLADAGVQYVWMAELGNIFKDSDYWQYRYRQLMNNAGYLLVDRLHELAVPFALICAERDVAMCHRKIIADFLAQMGYQAEHIP